MTDKKSDLTNSYNLFDRAKIIIEKSRNNITNSILSETTVAYYELGRLIVAEEQDKLDRADYGSSLIKNLSIKLKAQYGKGFSPTTLKDARNFYKIYQKSRSVTDQLEFPLSFTHYTVLMRLHENEREFYEAIAIKEKYKVRELKRAIASNLSFRMLKEGLKIGDAKIEIFEEKPEDVLRSPYVAEFLGLSQKEFVEGNETKVEKAILENLEHFLLELGKGFSFVGRQYNILISDQNYRADLVFYNIRLKRYFIIELKARKAQHKDIGQLQMYVNYFDREICDETDNQTIGLLLCKEQDKVIIDYTLPKDNKTIFTSELKLYLPTKEELNKFLLNDNEI